MTSGSENTPEQVDYFKLSEVILKLQEWRISTEAVCGTMRHSWSVELIDLEGSSNIRAPADSKSKQ